MAKDKKRGFFSWLGFGQKEKEQQEAEQQQSEAQPAPAEPVIEQDTQEVADAVTVEPVAEQDVERLAEPEAEVTAHSEAETEAFAEDVVEVTEEVAQGAIVQPVEPEAVIEHETLPLPEDIAAEEPAVVIEEEAVVAHQVQAEEATPVEAIAEETIAEEPTVEEPAVEEHAVEEPVVAETPVEEAVVEDVAEEELADVELSDEELEVQALAAADAAENAIDAPEETAEEADDAQTQQEQERPTKEGFFARLKRSLLKTKENLGSGFISLFRGKKIDDDLFEELEEQLLIADVGVETTRKIIANLTEGASRKQLRDAEALYGLLKDEMSEILAKVEEPLNIEGKTPFVILMVGVNGVGKTTTIGKLARQFEQQGKSVMLAAGDTFRAAAVEQLQVWGQRNDIPVIAQHTGADSASVIFDAIQAAKARNVDVLIADTAGRLQNKSHLMEELKKIVRVMKKLDEDAPHEIMLTIDASTGQNAISQAKLFHEAVGLTGIALTKLDGTAKGGVIFSVADQFGIPIRYIGVGERIEDLRPFKSDDFIEALFARED
ncbi:signal recognition particle-docking protein FtsY [Scandinavium sp. TWS1a]|uniref:signal recognition particle-docking protein FtsY n=1 Tax=Scandinavium tedordense TaxID=2926521 RepID=UPI00216661E5|nr:signal recognition particle-docking protein FtsY [Scandinavium tedordense]MCS2171109.1 signal recognition particle-docking protein FtsY [Scandinavium tedordense]